LLPYVVFDRERIPFDRLYELLTLYADFPHMLIEAPEDCSVHRLKIGLALALPFIEIVPDVFYGRIDPAQRCLIRGAADMGR